MISAAPPAQSSRTSCSSGSYHYLRFNQGQSYLGTVPRRWSGGEFQPDPSASNGTPAPAQLFNPFSVTQLGSNLYQRAPFPTRSFPIRIRRLSTSTASIRCPTGPPDDVYNTNNFTSTVVNTVRRQTLNNRVDYKRGRHSIYGNGGFDFGTILQPCYWGKFATKGFNDAPTTTKDTNPYGQVGDTIVIDPTLFVDVRYGATRTNAIAMAGNHSGFTQYSEFGIPPGTQALLLLPVRHRW